MWGLVAVFEVGVAVAGQGAVVYITVPRDGDCVSWGTVFPQYRDFDLLLVTFVYFEISKDKDYVRFGGVREKGMFLKH